MSNDIRESNNWTQKTRKNTLVLGYWTAGWLASMALATFGPVSLWKFDTTLTVMAVLVNLGVGFGMILANKRHLKGLDELHQKIQLEAMAISLGIGLVGGLAYSILDTTNVMAFHAEISHLVILLGLSYLGGIIFGHRRYQ